jgi:hypothetical protein
MTALTLRIAEDQHRRLKALASSSIERPCWATRLCLRI